MNKENDKIMCALGWDVLCLWGKQMNLGGLLMRDTGRCQNGTGGLWDTEGQESRSSLSLLLSLDLLCLVPLLLSSHGLWDSHVFHNRPYLFLRNYLHLLTFLFSKEATTSTPLHTCCCRGSKKEKIDFSTSRQKGTGKPQEILGVSRQVLAANVSKWEHFIQQ